MRIRRYHEPKLLTIARNNRREIIAAGLSRREMIRNGLIGASGYLAFKGGLSQWASGWAKGKVQTASTNSGPGGGGGGGGGGGEGGGTTSPPTRAWVDPLPIMPVKRPVTTLTGPVPTIAPNTSGGEGRTRAHQAFTTYPQKFQFPVQTKYEVHQRAAQVTLSPDLPVQTVWGFDGQYPGPTYRNMYGNQVLVRNFNDLPPKAQNGGFGTPEVSTHLHNGHTPSESDGFPVDFFSSGKFYDHHYPNVLAGFGSTHQPNGDIQETLSTLWYHDHRVDFTSQNVYKGLAGMYLLHNTLDTGDETTGFHLPGRFQSDFFSQNDFDVPLFLQDKVFDPSTGQMFFDLFNLDGILGDKFLVNGKVQPFFEVEPRRYRFRIHSGGPSRWYQIFLTDQGSNTQIPFWAIANDGNLMARPINVNNISMGVANRMEIIVDFRQWAGKTLYLENRAEQTDGRGPTGNTLPAGSGNFLLQFRVKGSGSADNSADPGTMQFYGLPSKSASPLVTRTFQFARSSGQWTINGLTMVSDGSNVRFRVKQNTVENWVLVNSSGGWMHPIHIHFEEFQILSQSGTIPEITEINSRKDVMRLQHNHTVQLFFRFRDFVGRYPMHCHNLVHEDHAMMLRWDIDTTGDTNSQP
jgi:FtsP/CotA-like multicopper oxidase with cupredoxin domain